MSNNIFTKPKDASYINSIQYETIENSISAKDDLYDNSFHKCSKETLKDDNNIFTKSKEAFYINPYQGGRTSSAIVTIDKNNIIYVDVDNEYVYKESYLEDHIFYC